MMWRVVNDSLVNEFCDLNHSQRDYHNKRKDYNFEWAINLDPWFGEND